MLISNIPLNERPRERCLLGGAKYLSARECIALIVGSGLKDEGSLGLAERILQRCGSELEEEDRFKNFVQAIMQEDLGFLRDLKGVGKARSAKLLAFAELARRITLQFIENFHPHAPASVYREDLEKKVLQSIPFDKRAAGYEWIGFVPVSKAGEVGAFYLLQKGDLGSVCLDVANFFRKLLLLDVRNFYLFHNHPSGSLTASGEDKALTRQIIALSVSLGLNFLGHWIVGRSGARRVAG